MQTVRPVVVRAALAGKQSCRHMLPKEAAMTRIAIAGSALMLGLVLSAGARAQTLVSAESPATLVSIIQELGFQAKLETDNVGDPVIRSSSNGVDFRIYFYECKNN